MYMIQTVGLTKRFGSFTANDHIDLAIPEKEITCIVGENGAGKTTLMNMLYGLLEPTEGEILIRGKQVKLRRPIDAIANGIGMVHQHFKLVPSLSVYENILLGAEITKKGGLIDQKEEIRRVEELIHTYHFELNPLDKVEDISVGSRQRVEILKMLYRNVDILILDEPTAVLTPQEANDLIDRLKGLKEKGKTIIVITHKLREVMEVSDNVVVIKRGKVVASMRPNCIEGTWGIEIDPMLPVDEKKDYVIRKRRYSGFFGTDLDLVLRQLEVKNLIIVGTKTNCCIRATVTDAFYLDYNPIVLSDCVATNSQVVNDVHLEDIRKYLGQVMTSQELFEKLRAGEL